MEQKMHNHSFHRVFFDILRDTNTSKYSMTKFACLVGLILLSITIIMGLIIMWKNAEIDHVFIVELIGFVLTLLGFKNSFGFKGNNGQTLNSTNNYSSNENSETDPDTGKKNNEMSKLNLENADYVNDSLKG